MERDDEISAILMVMVPSIDLTRVQQSTDLQAIKAVLFEILETGMVMVSKMTLISVFAYPVA